jgi:hypothetical protein
LRMLKYQLAERVMLYLAIEGPRMRLSAVIA